MKLARGITWRALLSAILLGGRVASSQSAGGIFLKGREPGPPKQRILKREKEPTPPDGDGPPPLLVDSLYTYGAPSVVLDPHQSNPGNKCSKSHVVGYSPRIRISAPCTFLSRAWIVKSPESVHTPKILRPQRVAPGGTFSATRTSVSPIPISPRSGTPTAIHTQR